MNSIKNTAFLLCIIALVPHIFIILLSIPPPPVIIAPVSPVIIIPGDGASALEVKFRVPKVKHLYCHKSSGGKWQRLWVPDLTSLLPGKIDCWADLVTLHYDDEDIRDHDHEKEEGGSSSSSSISSSGGVHNTTGVQIRVVPGLPGLELLSPKAPHLSSNVYRPLVKSLSNVNAATYDFRLTPTGNPLYLFHRVKNMIEDAYERAGQTRVTLVTHSLGGLYAHHFFTSVVDTQWKERYIHAWVPVSPAYGGVTSGLKQIVSGDAVGLPFVKGRSLRSEQRSYESSLWLLPSRQLYGGRVLVTGEDGRNYTALDYGDLAEDARFETFEMRFDRVRDLTVWDGGVDGSAMLYDPNVDVFPVYGNGQKTPIRYDYESGFDTEPKTITSMEGDGTVELLSLQAGNHWKRAHEALVLDGATHTDIFEREEMINHIHDIISIPSPPDS